MKIIKYLLSLNRYSRNGKKQNTPHCIVLHHNEIDGCGAIETRNYFDNLKNGKNAIYYSTHYIIGLDGEVICCIPEDEIAYHRGNSDESEDSISITYCSYDKKKKPNMNTLYAIRALVRDISKRYGFDIRISLLRHFDCSAIKCPLYYASNVAEWEKLKLDIIEEAKIENQLISDADKKAEQIASILETNSEYIYEILHGNTQIDTVTLAKIAGLLLFDTKISTIQTDNICNMHEH